MIKCLKCRKEVDNSLLCELCLEKDMGESNYGGIFVKPLWKEDLGNKCTRCAKTAMTIYDGVCNTCLSKDDDDDFIKFPSHYNTGKIQPIDVIEDWKLDFRLASAVKYIARHDHKGSAKKDLEKAIWYIQRFIDKELKDE